MSIRINSYFSGAGLFDIGFQQEGLPIQQSFEIDPIAVATQRRNFSHEVIECDIKQKLAFDENDCNVMIATYPCTKYSAIADIHGARTGDELFLHFFRHIALKEPDVYVVENVPGMLKFPVVMEAMTQLPHYYISTFCPVDATDVGLPQKRKRLFIIGSRKWFNWREPVPERRIRFSEIVQMDAPVKITTSMRSRMSGGYRDMPIITDPLDSNAIAPTCIAHYHKDRSTRVVRDRRSEIGVRAYTVREFARLMGVPDDFEFEGTENDQFKQIGNGVAVPLGRWIAKELKRYYA